MTPQEFRAALKRIRMSQVAFARHVRRPDNGALIHFRSVRRWATSGPVPNYAIAVLNEMIKERVP